MRLTIFLTLCFYTGLLYSQGSRLSERAEISVITCGPTQEEVFLAFGHSAIRVHDPIQGFDFAYNYGVFNFNQPNFYINFARGYSYYQLGVYSYPDFRDVYISENRYVHEQVLNLTIEQKQTVFDYLEWNASPENKVYRYDYFYDNCATKIRDVIATTLGDEVSFDGSYITTHYTIRELTDLYLEHQPWGDLGIDICLGLPMDKIASPYEYMFLPDFIESGFDHAFVIQNGVTKPLVMRKINVYETHAQEYEKSIFHPWVAFGLIFVIAITISVLDFKKKKLSKWFDLVLFSVTGLLGLLLLLLWMATDHKAAANNLNLLWALPSHLMIFGILKKNPRIFLQKYFLGVTFLSGFLLIIWIILPQQLNVFLIPLVASLLIRSLIISRFLTPSASP